MKHLQLFENFSEKQYWIQRVLHGYNEKHEHWVTSYYLGKDESKWVSGTDESKADRAVFTKAEAEEKITTFPKLHDVPSGSPHIKPYVQGYYPIETN